MGKYCFVVITTPVQGKEDEFNTWYTEQHLKDVLRVPGFVSAQRLKIMPETSSVPGKYIALYQMETDNPEACVEDLLARAGKPGLEVSEALDMPSTSFVLCSVIAERTKE